MEEQLDEKSIEFSNCVSRVKQLEHDVTFRDEEITRIQVELKEKQQALQQLRTSTDRNQQLHQEQCKDYEKQIEIVRISLFVFLYSHKNSLTDTLIHIPGTCAEMYFQETVCIRLDPYILSNC